VKDDGWKVLADPDLLMSLANGEGTETEQALAREWYRLYTRIVALEELVGIEWVTGKDGSSIWQKGTKGAKQHGVQ
jgi:hypothetical protein